jgi:hypothetical protein
MKTALSFNLLFLMAVQAIAADGLLLDLIVPPGEKDRFSARRVLLLDRGRIEAGENGHHSSAWLHECLAGQASADHGRLALAGAGAEA